MKTLLLWSVVVLVAGVGSAQTTLSLSLSPSPSARLRLPPARTGPTQATLAQAKPAQAIPTQAVTPRPSCVTTNAQPKQGEQSLQVQPHRSFQEDLPQLAFDQLKANELALDGHTLSGIVVQVIKAKRPFQLLNPAALPQYGSGWDNIEWFPASGSGPMLKLFSIGF